MFIESNLSIILYVYAGRRVASPARNVIKRMNCVLKTRNCVLKTRNCVLKMMHFAGSRARRRCSRR